ncbi:MAG: nitroreductase family protein [Alphaproteobacteria bacterium]
MNPIINQLQNRRSIREFTGEPVKAADLQTILQTAQHAPTYKGAQQISLIVVDDKEKIKQIAECAGGQAQIAQADVFIVIIADFNRTAHASQLAGKEQVIDATAEGLLIGAVDAGIMLNAIQVAAESLGYGTTAIGGIRKSPEKMIELLGLPKNTYPIVGTTIGVPNKDKYPQIKPRVPFDAFAFTNTYNDALVKKGVKEYDAILRKWWDTQGLSQIPSYINLIGDSYSHVFYPTIAQTLAKQGFDFKDE